MHFTFSSQKYAGTPTGFDKFRQKVYDTQVRVRKEVREMFIAMFNGWYFFWLILSAGAIVGLYFLLRNRSEFTQKAVLFGLLAFGLLLHFLKLHHRERS